MANVMEVNSSPPLSLSTPNVRKSSRQSLPNSSLILRRQLISDKFKILTPKTNRKTTPITYVKRKNAKVQKKLFAEKETKHSSDDVEILQNPVIKTDDVQSDQKPVTLLEKDAVVREKNANLLRKDANVLLKDANLLEIGRSFVVTKDAGVTSILDRDIHPTYFPSEAENSGIIVFKSHSRRAVLNISFPKCFVILNGTFNIDEQGIFNMGDFIKAPAGSKLGIKYLGGGNEFGKIIFFKSVT